MPVPGTEGGSFPYFLPDGQRFIYVRAGVQNRDLWLASLDLNEKPRRLGEVGEQPIYSAGHLLSVVNGILMAQPFDPARGELIGQSFPLKASLAHLVHFGRLLTDFSANAQGMLVYPPHTNSLMELRWRDRTGKQLGSLGAPGEYYTPRISPDGTRVAFTRRDGNNSDLWVAKLDTNSFTRLTFDPATDSNPFPLAPLQPDAVLRVESLELRHAARAVRNEIKLAVRQNAIHIHQQHLDLRRNRFLSRASTIPV